MIIGPVSRAFSALAVAGMTLLGIAWNDAQAAPVSYSFTTGPVPFGGPSVAGGPFPDPTLFVGGASGTFRYDAAALAILTAPDGSIVYRGSSPASATGFVTAISGLAGSVAGLGFSDVAGTAQVGNDTFLTGSQKVDFFQLSFDPSLASTSPRNLGAFSIAGFTLRNVRMFWIEGQQTPETIPDFLGDQDLPGAPPSFHGRMAFDFTPTSSPAGPLSFVFFDNLSVHPVAAIPEPDTYAMLLAGLGLLVFVARRQLRGGRIALG